MPKVSLLGTKVTKKLLEHLTVINNAIIHL